MKKKYVYVVVSEVYGTADSGVNVSVCATKKDALTEFKRVVKEMKSESDYDTIEEDELSFLTYNKINCLEQFVLVFVEKKEILEQVKIKNIINKL